MISIETAIKMTEEEINNLPRGERKKAIKTRESWNRFREIVEQVRAMNLDKDIEISVHHSSPAGMTELPNSNFHYNSKDEKSIMVK